LAGWIKLYRELFDKAIWAQSTLEQKVILITLLSMASHKQSEWEWKGQKFKIQPGQFVTSLDKIVLKCGEGVTEQKVRTALKRLEKYEFLTNESTKTGRLITIVNWRLYQDNEEEPNKDSNSQLTITQQTPNKQLTPIKNDKNNKNERMKENIKDIAQEYTDDSELITAILDFSEMRKTIKKPLTTKALSMMLEKLNSLGKTNGEKVAILNQSIMNSWQSVFLLKDQEVMKREPVQKISEKHRGSAYSEYD